MTWRGVLAALLLAATVTACGEAEEVAKTPLPAEVAGDSTGYFCGMLLAEHGGPKGQIHLKDRGEPIWFSSVRDTIAFTRLEEEPKDILAIYVNDMGRATNWEQPEPDTWVDAREAWFVTGSSRVGGMGLPEPVPFGTREGADAFAAERGGTTVRLSEISDDYVLGTPGAPTATEQSHGMH